jgi:hypothetical protein
MKFMRVRHVPHHVELMLGIQLQLEPKQQVLHANFRCDLSNEMGTHM